MAFELKDISGINLHLLNNFFLNGFEGNKLVEQSQKINLPFVDIQSNEWYFDGIRMGFSDWRFTEPIEIKWGYDLKVELVTFMANLKGSVRSVNSLGQDSPIMGNYQHNLFYSNANEKDKGILKSEGSRASMFFIQFTKDAFLKITQDANPALNRFCDNVLNGRPALLSAENLPLDASMQNMISNILNCGFKSGIKKMFLFSKAIEFLVLQAEACNSTSGPSYKFIKSNYDKDCIRYAREYILSHIEMPPSLSELSKIIGINEYKLKRGFKEVYGNTVFGFLSETRLELAKNELLEGKKKASEIASGLGYSSVQHFSNSFKNKFGVSPSKLRKIQ